MVSRVVIPLNLAYRSASRSSEIHHDPAKDAQCVIT
jgi:hypothetical protein